MQHVNEDDRYTADEAREHGFTEEEIRYSLRGRERCSGRDLLGQRVMTEENARIAREEAEATARRVAARKRA